MESSKCTQVSKVEEGHHDIRICKRWHIGKMMLGNTEDVLDRLLPFATSKHSCIVSRMWLVYVPRFIYYIPSLHTSYI